MALVSSFSSLLDSPISLFAFITVSLWFLQSYVRLRHVPGPLLASLTNLPRASWVVSNRAHDIHIALHRKYGKLVRFGPNMISVADPAEIANIYGFTGKFRKVQSFSRDTLFLFIRTNNTFCSLTSTMSSSSTPRVSQCQPSLPRKTRFYIAL